MEVMRIQVEDLCEEKYVVYQYKDHLNIKWKKNKIYKAWYQYAKKVKTFYDVVISLDVVF